MHYEINGYMIKSENAALSTTQTNANIIKYISDLCMGQLYLDYGCGKCRYSKQLCEKAKQVVLVDSEIQITRTQKIHNETTSVQEYAKNHLKNATVFSLHDENWKVKEYDFILCTNVLSAIPDMDEREKLLENIASLLSNDGTALISVQYSNSYFKTYETNPKAIKHEDGWIIKKGNSYSFYGIIKPDKLIEMCKKANLKKIKDYRKEGTIYLTVKSK